MPAVCSRRPRSATPTPLPTWSPRSPERNPTMHPLTRPSSAISSVGDLAPPPPGSALARQEQSGMIAMIAMAQLIVRDIDKALVDLLKRRAAAHGRSAEAEHREHLLAMPDVGDDADFAIERSRARKVTL